MFPFSAFNSSEELNYRNSLQPPHLKSTYAAQYDLGTQDDDLKVSIVNTDNVAGAGSSNSNKNSNNNNYDSVAFRRRTRRSNATETSL